MSRLFLHIVLSAHLLTLPLCAAAGLPPDVRITAFHASLTEAMRNSSRLGCEGRIKLLQPAVEATFDLPFVAERALRRHWASLDATQHEHFLGALRTSFITTYATEFATADAVAFSTSGSERLGNGDALVHTLLTPKGEAAITLDYVLKPRGDDWRVVNVLADGVSDLALRATQYDALMKKEGFPGLIAKLGSQTQQLKARCK